MNVNRNSYLNNNYDNISWRRMIIIITKQRGNIRLFDERWGVPWREMKVSLIMIKINKNALTEEKYWRGNDEYNLSSIIIIIKFLYLSWSTDE